MDLYSAFWGLCGALVYASTRLVARLWGGEPATGRAQRRAWAQFAVAVLTGPVAAAGWSATIVGWLHGAAKIEAIALTLGLSANTLWPVLVDGLNRRGRLIAGDIDP